jgi:hypothetical protein
MIHGIEQSRSSMLGTGDWLTLPWRRFHKDSLQELYDNGFTVAAILEKVDQLGERFDTAASINLSETCLEAGIALEMWYSKHWGTLDHTVVLLLGGLFEASNLVYYWWFKIVLNQVLISLGGQTSTLLHDMGNSLQKFDRTNLEEENTILASNIVGATPFFSAEDTGWVGPQRLLFPLKRAMIHLGMVKSPVFPKAQSVFMQLIRKMRPAQEW